MALDVQKLLAAIPGDNPVGPDLAYDPVRHHIEQAFDASVSIDASGVADSVADTDWRPIISAIVTQFDQTKDVWLAVYLCRAGVQAGRLGIVGIGAQALAGLLERYWPQVHPGLDEYGFQGRKGACDTLVTFREFVGPLGRATLVEHNRLGRFTAADLVRFHRGGETEEGYGLFRAAVEEGLVEGLLDAKSALDLITDGFQRSDAVLVQHAGQDSGTNFAAVYALIADIQTAIVAFLPPRVGAEDGVLELAEHDATTSTAAVHAEIRNRDDVIRQLALVIDYYSRNEPASPVPLLLERAKTWVALDFLSVLRDISPGAIDDARAILQARNPD